MQHQLGQSHAYPMKRYLPAILATITLGFPFSLAGQEAATEGRGNITGANLIIEGAFGQKFGEKFTPDPTARIEQGEHQGGYRFTPQKPNPQFSEYIVFVTPNSHRIYGIVGVSTYEEKEIEKGIQFSERLTKY